MPFYSKKLHPLDFQTHSFGAVIENLHELISAFHFPLFQSVFKLQFSVLMSVAFLCRCLLSVIPKDQSYIV